LLKDEVIDSEAGTGPNRSTNDRGITAMNIKTHIAISALILTLPYGATATDVLGLNLPSLALHTPKSGKISALDISSDSADRATARVDSSLIFTPEGKKNLRVITGDWNGDGVDTVGAYNPKTGIFYLSNDNATGSVSSRFAFKPAGKKNLLPVSGDWDGDGTDTIGLYNPKTGDVYLNGSNNEEQLQAEFRYRPDGRKNLLPVAGDWNADGIDTVALVSRQTGFAFLADRNDENLTSRSVYLGTVDKRDLPVAEDWDGDGVSTLGLLHPKSNTVTLHGPAGEALATIALTIPKGTYVPLAGKWPTNDQNVTPLPEPLPVPTPAPAPAGADYDLTNNPWIKLDSEYCALGNDYCADIISLWFFNQISACLEQGATCGTMTRWTYQCGPCSLGGKTMPMDYTPRPFVYSASNTNLTIRYSSGSTENYVITKIAPGILETTHGTFYECGVAIDCSPITRGTF
jgi:hypothetical protein